MPEPAFKRLGKYEIQAQLGRGGFGTVYRGFDPTVGRLVAIKVLVSEGGKDLLTRFRNEAIAAGNLRHENIVTIYEFGEDRGMPFIAMEYLEGEDLQQALASGKPLTLLEKVSIMTQAAAGLDCAHRHGVVHRDVKPANIRLLPDGTVKIMDFGIARLMRDSGVARLTRQGHVLGTLLYMAPEQVMSSESDALCDIFAYGVTFYELLTGRHPFHAEDPRSVFYKITSEDPELIHHLVPNCPETLDHVIRRALQKDRELRYQTLRDLRVDVEPVLIALRKERAAALAADAHGLVADRHFERALSLLNEAIDLDSGSHTARQLRDIVLAELRRRLVRPRIEALLTKADQWLAEGNYNDALQTIEAALRLDPEDAALHSRSREAQQQRDQTRESNRLLSEARADLAQDSLTAALHKASEAIALNPRSVDARSLFEIVQLEINKRERQQRLNEKLRQARELLLLNSLNEALAVIDTLEPDERETPEAIDLLARLAAQQAEHERQERLRAETAVAREFLEGGRFIDAVQLLQRLRTEFPGEPRIGALLSNAERELAALERARALESIQKRVLTHAEAKRFEEAVELLESATKDYPEETGILRLQDTVLHAKSVWERQQAIDQTLRRCEALADRNQFEEALAVLREARQRYPDEAALDELQRSLNTDWERFRTEQAVLSALGASDRLMNEGRPEDAVAKLEAALAKASDERLQTALARARQVLAAKQRVALLEQIHHQVRLHIEKHEFDRAFDVLDSALAGLAGEPSLARLREATLSAKTAWERDEAIAAAEKTAQALRSEQRLEEAMAVVRACQENFPSSPVLARLDADLRKDLERQHRAEAVRAALEQAQELASRNDLAGAVELLRRTSTRFPGESAVNVELVRAEAAWAAEQEIAAAVRECESLSAEEKYKDARDVAESALRTHPEAPDLIAARLMAVRGLERQNRETDIAKCVAQAMELIGAGRPGEAVEALRAAMNRLGSDARFDAALADAETAIRAKRRAEAIRAAVQEADRMVADDDPAAGIAALERALREHGAVAELVNALERARKAERNWNTLRERRATLQPILQRCADLIGSGNLAEAGRSVQNAMRDFPEEPELVAMQQRLRTEWDGRRRSEALRRATDNARALLDQGQPTRAIELLEAAATQYPDDAGLREALARARKAQGEQRKAQVESVCRETRICLAKNDFDEALKTVEMSLETLSGERRLVQLRRTVIAARRDFERQASGKRAASVGQAVTDEVPMAPLTREVEMPAPVANPLPPQAPPLPRASSPQLRTMAFASIGCALALAAVLLGIRAFGPGVAKTALTVETEPAGATVRIGERSCITPNCSLDLPSGNYRVEGQLPGYAAASEVVSVRKKETARVRLVLVPLPTSLVVTSNFTAGSVYLDETAVGQLRDGQFALEKLPAGLHRLKVTSPDGEASLSLKSGIAMVPEWNGGILSRDAGVIVITSLNSSVRAKCSRCEGALMLDGKPVDGKGVAAGAHEITAVMAGGQARRASFRNGEAPAIAIHLNSTANPAGTLVVEANVDGATVSIDRRRLDRQTEAGRLVVPLEPRNYSIEIQKQGYRVSPARLVAKIRKGNQFHATFRLDPIPGTVVLSGVAEGATVLVDGTTAGTVRGGSFAGSVSPGAHTVTLTKEGFKASSTQRSFAPGETVRLDSAALHLEPLPQAPKQPVQPQQQAPQPSAEEIEAGEWAVAISGRDRAAIQAFLQKHPDTAHRQEAQQMIEQLEWDALDRKERAALERFAARYRRTPLAQQAAAEIARIDSEAAAIAAKTIEDRITADRAEIARVLAVYATAFEKKDLALLKTVWPGLPENALAAAFRGNGELRQQLRPQSPAEFKGDVAAVRCVRVTEQVTQFGRQKPVEEARTVRLQRENGRWIISAID